MVPAVSDPLGGNIPVDTATITAAAAMPAPIRILRLPELLSCALMFFSPLKDGPRCEIGWTVAELPGIAPGVSVELAPSTRGFEKSWRTRPQPALRCGIFAKTAATRPSGGGSWGTRRKSSNIRRRSSNWVRAAGLAASSCSKSRTSSDVAAPSRTMCINGVCSSWLMSVCAQVLQHVGQTVPRLEQSRFHRFFVQIQNLPDLLVTAF